MGNQELTLLIIKAWQARRERGERVSEAEEKEREKERERERERIWHWSLILSVWSVVCVYGCMSVCVRTCEVCFFRTAPTASAEKQPGIKA